MAYIKENIHLRGTEIEINQHASYG